jgi:Arc/MetJ-type ribon-helix-helix transcriptional regulator
MIIGMTGKTKIAVSLPSDLVIAAREAVAEGKVKSVSAYVADALAERIKLDDLDALLRDLLTESGGPLTDTERAEVDSAAGWD